MSKDENKQMEVTMKKFLAIMIALIMIVSCLPVSAAADASGEKITMLFSAGGSGKAIQAAAERFTQATGIETEVLLFSIDEVYEKQVLSLSHGSSDIDIVALNDPWVPMFQDYLFDLKNDLGDEFLGEFIPGMLETFESDGKVIGIPVRMGGDVVVYRKDVFASLGIVPADIQTWDDLYETAHKMTADGKYGWAMGMVEPSNVVKSWYEFLICYGGSIMNENGDGFSFNSDAGIAATEMFKKIVTDCCPPDILTYSFNDQIDAMKTGLASMGLLWTSRYPSVNASDGEYSGQFAVLPLIPGGGNSEGVACVDGWAVGISKYTSNYDACLEFVKFIGSPEEQLNLAISNSNSPTIASIYENEEYLAVVPEAVNMNSALEVSVARPQEVFFSDVEEQLALYIKLACLGDMSVEDALAECEEKCMEILEDYE